MPAKSREGLRELAVLFAQYGVDMFLESTTALVAVLDGDGKLLAWNPSFEQLKQNLPDAKTVHDFLSAPSKVLFDEFLKSALNRAGTQAGEP